MVLMELLAAILPAAFGILSILFIFGIILYAYLMSKHVETTYKHNVIEIIKNCKKSEINQTTIDKMKNAYDVYRNRNYGFGYKDIIQLNQQLEQDLRTNTYKKYYKTGDIKNVVGADNLDLIINFLKEQLRFDDEKANELFENLSKELQPNQTKIIYDFKIFLSELNAFNKGRLFEKEYEISSLKQKLKRKHWFSYILGGIGLLSSIITILGTFNFLGF